MSMPATLSIVRQVFTHPQERAVAIGIWSAVASGGAALGPLIGGLLLKPFLVGLSLFDQCPYCTTCASFLDLANSSLFGTTAA